MVNADTYRVGHHPMLCSDFMAEKDQRKPANLEEKGFLPDVHCNPMYKTD